MKKIYWKDIAELVGIAGIIVSLIFLALQIRQQQRASSAEATVAYSTLLAEVNQSINENREIWVRGLKGDELSETDQSVFNRMAMTFWRYKVAQILSVQRLRLDAETTAERYAYQLYIYPGLRRWFQETIVQFNDARAVFGREPLGPGSATFQVQEALAEIDRRSPPIPERKSYDLWY